MTALIETILIFVAVIALWIVVAAVTELVMQWFKKLP